MLMSPPQKKNLYLYQTLSIWLGTQFTQPNPELGPLQGVFFNLNQSIEQKIKNLQCEKCRFITDIKITFWDTAKYFHSKHLKSCPQRHKKHVFAKYRCFRA